MSNDNLKATEMDVKLKSLVKTDGLANDIVKDISKSDIPKNLMTGILVNKPTYPVIDTNQMDEFHAERAKQKREELEREFENNESLKSLVVYNQELVDYNLQLVNLNEGILKKINVIGNAMDDITINIQEGKNYSKESDEEQTKLLLQLISIMESKDNKSALGDFLKGLTGDISAGLITAYLQYKIGLS